MRVALYALLAGAIRASGTDRPVIGIVAQPVPMMLGVEYIAASYVKFVEAAGGRVVPLSYRGTNATTNELLGQLNGVLFPGGAAKLPDVARAALAYSAAAAARGEVFPVWGTCLGFEWMMEAIGGAGAVVSGFDSENASLPLALTDAAATSRLYGGPEKARLRANLAKEPLAMNNHNRGTPPAAFASNAALAKTFAVLSTNVDRAGKPFASSVESRDGVHLYAVQWHPEKNAYEAGEDTDGTPHEAINHSRDAVAATFSLASAFVDAARASTQTFKSAADREARLTYHCSPVATFYPGFVSTYLFPKNWTGAEPACPREWPWPFAAAE